MKKILKTPILLLLSIIFSANYSYAEQPVKLAIVIDDIGNNQYDQQILKLPTAITLSILPYTPYAKSIAHLAQMQEREFLVHIPMQAKNYNGQLDKGALMLNMPQLDFEAQLRQALDYFPNATGINNHMGSTLTEHVKQMQWTMDVIKQRGIYFLDSRTTANTIAESTAKLSGIPALRRHVFLDNIKTEQAMEEQYSRAIALGKRGNAVVIIGHPYPETIHFLSNKFKQKDVNVELVSLQSLLSNSTRLALNKKRGEFHQAKNNIITGSADAQPQQTQ